MKGGFRAACASGAACAALLGCTDPRARPVSPVVQVSFAPAFQLTSPGQIQASLYMFDADGLKSVDLSVSSSDTILSGDSLIGLPGDPEITRPIIWTVPAGMASGTQVTLIARVTALTDFATTDTTRIVVQ